MPTQTSPEFLTLQRAVAGRYSLERELGRGGMGVVFLARDVALDRPVAIKLLPPSLAIMPDLRERFLREARTAAKLSHPNIVPIFAVEEHGDLVFFVMGFVDGESLGQRVRRAGPLAASAAIRLIQEVAWALAYAHGRGVIHRDIKPDNILIEKGSNRALVTDFGIARIADQSGVTGKGEILGTAHYMSPEQATGEPLDGRSDLYSLGVTAYFALTGTLPFDGATLPAVLTRVLTEAPPRVATRRPHLPARLAEAVDRCLAKTPAERFATGEELAEAAGTALVARGETPPELRLLLRRAQEGDYWLALFFVLLNTLPILMDEVWPVNHRAVILIGLMLGAQVVGFPITMLLTMRRVLKAGLGPSDVQRAIEQATSDRLEEQQLLRGSWTVTPPPSRRRIWTLVGGTLLVGGVGLSVAGVRAGLVPAVIGGVILVGSVAMRLPQAEDWGKRRAMGLGLRLLNSRLGRFLFRIAGLGVKVGQQNLPPATERTELVLGDAAGALFDALPSEVRKRFTDVPAAIKRLEDDASVLRAREQVLSNAIARAEPDRAASVGIERRGAAVAELAQARDATKERLATAVAALENIRLDLLKLQAGVGSMDDLTADLESAREINEAVKAELAARAEVERVLHR
jgi:eukaryotic-like serine/threonine-protein kinase